MILRGTFPRLRGSLWFPGLPGAIGSRGGRLPGWGGGCRWGMGSQGTTAASAGGVSSCHLRPSALRQLGPRPLLPPGLLWLQFIFQLMKWGGGCVLAAAPGDAAVLKASPPGGCSLRPRPLPSPAPAPGGLRVPPARASAAWGLTPPARGQGQSRRPRVV